MYVCLYHHQNICKKYVDKISKRIYIISVEVAVLGTHIWKYFRMAVMTRLIIDNA